MRNIIKCINTYILRFLPIKGFSLYLVIYNNIFVNNILVRAEI